MPGEDARLLAQPDEVSKAVVSLCLAEETRHGMLISQASV